MKEKKLTYIILPGSFESPMEMESLYEFSVEARTRVSFYDKGEEGILHGLATPRNIKNGKISFLLDSADKFDIVEMCGYGMHDKKEQEFNKNLVDKIRESRDLFVMANIKKNPKDIEKKVPYLKEDINAEYQTELDATEIFDVIESIQRSQTYETYARRLKELDCTLREIDKKYNKIGDGK
ncbi:hypothetical protein GF361_00140 [Candidatus Woesearchaeota archaeon]|nr:hypothetical protein [Candidatus Woesearchaeota archaeon]